MRSTSPENQRRGRRARAVAWSATGLTTALLLITGSLAALNTAVLDGGSWHSYDDGAGASIVLAPGGTAAGNAGTGGVRGPVDVLASPEEPAAVASVQGDEETVTVTPRPAGAARTTPRRASAPTIHEADRASRVPARTASTQNEAAYRAGVDTVHDDGPRDRPEYRVEPDPPPLDTAGQPDALQGTGGDQAPAAVEQVTPEPDPAQADDPGAAHVEDPGAAQTAPVEPAP